jgi:uncharacterized protein
MTNDKIRMANNDARHSPDCKLRQSSFRFRHFLGGAFLLLFALSLQAAEVLPPAPARYFNDYAGVVGKPVAQSLNTKLEDFEKTASSQIVVAIYPKMQTDSSIEDYAQRIFDAWKPGQKKLNNGAILLVFVQDHKMRIHTGYGLEGALPDVICKRILDDEIAPRLKAGDFDGGMTAGVDAIMAAARGEYKGIGRTHGQAAGRNDSALPVIFFLVVILIFILSKLRRGTATQYGANGRRSWNQGWYIDTTNSGGSGGGWSGGGGGGFSGGGGSSGGGGASGGW